MAEKKEENAGNMNAVTTNYRMKTLSPALYLFCRKTGRKI
jgi:hypothetical protein